MIGARLNLLPGLVLATALGVTWLVWDHERRSAREELRLQFDSALREAASRIEQRISGYEQMLRGVQGLFATAGRINRSAFRDYVDTLRIDANFSGIQAVGVAERVLAENRDAHVAGMRSLGFAGYDIYPEGQRELYTPVIQREAYIGRIQTSLGFDPWSDPVRRLAMEQACDSGMTAISGKLQLKVDTEANAPPGFIMYLPIFERGQPRDSVSQRRAHIIGWVYIAFRMNDFMASLYGEQLPGLALAIYDGVEPSDATLLYRSANFGSSASDNTANEYLVVAGHTWTLTMSSVGGFAARFGHDATTVIAVAGTGLSLLLALLAWLLATGRDRALRLAASMNEELRHMAQHDALTGLPNRTLFSDRLQHELVRARRNNERFALIFLDLDRFKPINDNFGHAVGDKLLQQTAHRLQGAIRASDTVGRIGGDEFVVLMPELAEPGDALKLAEKICLSLRHPFAIDGREFTISCSLGVAVYPEDGADEIALSKCADDAMYRAKDGGRDSVRMGKAP